jgi:hypothetical protein
MHQVRHGSTGENTIQGVPEWTRPYHEDRYPTVYIVATLASAAGLLPVCGAMSQSVPVPGLIAVLVFSLLWQAVLWRVVLVGLYVGDLGIKVRMVVRTTVVPWSRIVRARIGPATGNRRARAIWIVVRDSDDVETPIWQTGRPYHRNRIKLPPQQQADLVSRITETAMARQGSAPS